MDLRPYPLHNPLRQFSNNGAAGVGNPNNIFMREFVSQAPSNRHRVLRR